MITWLYIPFLLIKFKIKLIIYRPKWKNEMPPNLQKSQQSAMFEPRQSLRRQDQGCLEVNWDTGLGGTAHFLYISL